MPRPATITLSTARFVGPRCVSLALDEIRQRLMSAEATDAGWDLRDELLDLIHLLTQIDAADPPPPPAPQIWLEDDADPPPPREPNIV